MHSLNQDLKDSRFPNWEKTYAEQKVEGLPWYYEDLDPDLAYVLKTRDLNSGTFLDLGTGPGTQAIQLSHLGFQVTGSDISQSAIEKAHALSSKVKFIKDDILHTALNESFDYVFDRGCFHTISPEERSLYAQNLAKICKKIFFLKCFSDKQEEWNYGPHRFSNEEIEKIFEKNFDVLSHKHTVYQGVMDPLPKAIFVVLGRK